jgi:catechol 2,3-dioxygenase-like lactoylglutathione lyase family enzyme
MLNASPIIAFVATANPERARTFYTKTIGLTLVSEDPFALVFDAGGTMLRVAIVPSVQAAGYTVLGWIVPDIAKAVDALTSRGASFTRYDGMGQDGRGIWQSPSGARVAWFKDPDGNTLSLTQMEGATRRNTSSRPKRSAKSARTRKAKSFKPGKVLRAARRSRR